MRLRSVGSHLVSGSILWPSLFLGIEGIGGVELDCGGGLATGAGGVAAAEAQEPACGFNLPLADLLFVAKVAFAFCGVVEGTDCIGIGELKPCK